MKERILRLKSPLITQFEITPDCNNNCPMCYNFWVNPRGSDAGNVLRRKTPLNTKRIFDLMNVLAENEVQAVCFTGGEPLMTPEILFSLLGEAKSPGMYTSINSNGRLIDKNVARTFRSAGLNSALVSLHGDSAECHGETVGVREAFEETLRGIENLLEAGVRTTVNYVATQKNVGRIVETARMLRGRGVRNMTVTPLLPFPGVREHEKWAMQKEQFKAYFDSLVEAKDLGLKVDSTLPVAPCILTNLYPQDYRRYLEVLSPRICGAGVTFMVVSPQGFNRACIQAPELKEFGGDIAEDFKQAWKNAGRWAKRSLLVDKCREDCYALPVCGGGCRTSSLAQNGSVRGKTMYMGEPLSKEDAIPFIERIEVPVDKTLRRFRKNPKVNFRKEEFGGVLFNPERQAAVVLTHTGVQGWQQLPQEFKIDCYEGDVAVLYAAGMLAESDRTRLPWRNPSISIAYASQLFPRLGHNLPYDNKVRMLRADTGERIYF